MASGLKLLPGLLGEEVQRDLIAALRTILAQAPLYRPEMPGTGKPFSVRMSNCGSLGWVADRDGGYRYQPDHPVTTKPWPAMPDMLLAIWRAHADYPAAPEACLINWYETTARMGLHRDADEDAKDAPVLSISLVIRPCSAWAGQSAATRPAVSPCHPAMCWCWVGKRGIASTGWTVSCPVPVALWACPGESI